MAWEQHFDQAGNVISAKEPGHNPSTYSHDSRGLTTSETLPDLAKNGFRYESTGALEQYKDPTAEATTDVNDELGRPLTRTYQDGTIETYVWEATRLKTFTDRQGRKQQYGYDDAGRLSDVADLNSNNTPTPLDHLEYDAAGRLTRHVTKDAMIEWRTFDLDGHPLTTRQTRFKSSTGLSGPVILDQYEQTHTWNGFGERTSWTMPRPSSLAADGWTATVRQEYDGAGNLQSITRTQTGGANSTLMTATYRNAGRPTQRTVTTSCTGLALPCTPATIVRKYGYDDASGQLSEMEVLSNGTTVAGSHVGYQNTLQAHDLQMLGVSAGKRSDHFSYDPRGRFIASILGTNDPNASPTANLPGTSILALTPADFMTAHQRSSLFDGTTAGVMASRGVSAGDIDPPSATFVERPMSAHKTATVTENGVNRSILYDHDGGQVSDDGRLLYTWDARVLLLSASEKPVSGGTTIGRVLYDYDGNHRIVGRRKEMALVFSTAAALDWKLEDRAQVLALDTLPPDVTFVWDPVSDNLVTVVQVGAPASDPNGGVLKQIIHGGLSYDDPIEETVPAPAGSTSTLQRLYPTYDEAGAGLLQTVMGVSGELVGRNVPTAIYTARQLHMSGAAVEEVTLEAAKDKNGALTTVEVTLHTTEQLTASTIATGVRLATVDSKGAVVRTATTPAQLVASDPYAAHITLTADEWTTLTDPAATSPAGLPAQALSVAATSTLRAKTWSAQTPILPAPDWARATLPVFATAALPVEVRESLPTLADWLKSIPASGDTTRPLYKITSLALLAQPSAGASTPINTLLAARFQAQPFADLFTGLNNGRERWYDPNRGSWLSLDPMGNRDSANLYALAGGDPVNQRDPTGLYEEDVHEYLTWFLAQAAGFDETAASLIGWQTQQLDEDSRQAMFGVRSAGAAMSGDATDILAYALSLPSNPKNMREFHMVSERRLREMRGSAMAAIGLQWWDNPADLQTLAGKERTDYRVLLENSPRWIAVGEYVHALEDSYSHQKGITERDFSATYNTIIGHAFDFHYNDWTWTRDELALKMAKDVYDNLVSLCHASQSICRTTAWPEIESTVRTFIITVPERSHEVQLGVLAVPTVRSYQRKVSTLTLTTSTGRLLGGCSVRRGKGWQSVPNYLRQPRGQILIPVWRAYP